MSTSRSSVALLFFTLVVAGCPLGPGDEPDPTSPDALVGVWQYTIAGDVESSLEFRSDGTFTVVDADFAQQRCDSEAGTWSAAGGVITVQVLSRNGSAVSEPTEDVQYDISGSQLSTNYGNGDSETWARTTAMPTCADYGWWRLEMHADIDGVRKDFTVHLDEVPGQSVLLSSSVAFRGWAGVPGGGTTACVSCEVVEIELSVSSGGPLVPGSYEMSASRTSQLSGLTIYRPAYPSSATHYVSENEPPDMVTGTLVVTSVSATFLEGTFDVTVYDTRAQMPFPSVAITNGYFRFSFQ